MSVWNLCLAWNWEHDASFVHLLEGACAHRALTVYQVTPGNLDVVLGILRSAEYQWKVFLDRASDSDPRFQPLVDWMQEQEIPRINPQEQARWSRDKATMHLEFLTAGLETPHTIILPPYHEQADIAQADLDLLNGQFAIKPACGGGGEGVVLEASSWGQVMNARRQFPAEKYLLQAHIYPQLLDGRPAWFRILFCDGAIHPCWWNPQTHIYSPVTAEERFRYGLHSLYEMTRRIALVCRLSLFSTEIAFSVDGRFVTVDYVNDPVDLRIQSAATDGVPDDIVINIAKRLALLTERQQNI